MIEIVGKYNKADVFAENIDETTQKQIQELCDAEFSQGSKIAIMPDCHAGAGCVIGTTMTIGDYICPNIVGVDIGCGVKAVKLVDNVSGAKPKINLDILDNIIHLIPNGFSVWSNGIRNYRIDYKQLKCGEYLKNRERLQQSMGTLGGGNHFIELGRDSKGFLWLTVHTGSRNLGLQVANYYQSKAKENHKELGELAYLEDELKDDYLHDMKYCQEFAYMNRDDIIATILNTYNSLTCSHISFSETISSVHNYIQFKKEQNTNNEKADILRKGAISAYVGENILVPLNMAQGTLICKGKSNKNYNFSAPHGAGRVMSRKQAKQNISVEEYQEKMKNIYTTTANENTLDEAPQAYKKEEDIIPMLKETADIIDKIVPIYNFKSID